MRRRRDFGSKAMTKVQMILQWRQLVASCRDDRLADLDPQSAANMFGVTPERARLDIEAEIARRASL